MGVFSSKVRESHLDTPPARPCTLQRIEDPRSPTEEVTRTPIEIAADKFSMREANDNPYRNHALKEQNQSSDFSPRIRQPWISKDLKKLKTNFASTFERESTDSDTVVDSNSSEKENSMQN